MINIILIYFIPKMKLLLVNILDYLFKRFNINSSIFT